MEQLTPPPTIVTPAVARATIAAAILDDAIETPRTAGKVRLQQHQISAIARIRAALEEFGGALLCDPVGTGKTFTALAVAPPTSRILIVAPAVLRDMWTRAADMTRRNIHFTSFESLSRGSNIQGDFDFIIVDEAHHARNPAARRYSVLAKLVSRRKVVLLTA